MHFSFVCNSSVLTDLEIVMAISILYVNACVWFKLNLICITLRKISNHWHKPEKEGEGHGGDPPHLGDHKVPNLTAICLINCSFLSPDPETLYPSGALKASIIKLNQNLPAYKKLTRKLTYQAFTVSLSGISTWRLLSDIRLCSISSPHTTQSCLTRSYLDTIFKFLNPK